MTLQGDYLLDRRWLRRRLTVWRAIALVLAVVAVVSLAPRLGIVAGGEHIARITVDGIIFDDRDRGEALERLAENDRVRALIVHINSPGGTVVGGEALYHQLRAVAEKKPVAAVMSEVATSAAYMGALGTDHIVAREGTITGSIGVILQSADITELLKMIGVKPETIKSAPLKAQPNPFEPFTPEAREAVRELIASVFGMFVDLVAERRQLAKTDVRELADGRVYSGRFAKDAGLVDALGGEKAAVDWLVETHGLDPDLDVRDVAVAARNRSLRDTLIGTFGKTLFSETLKLDGLVSLWHPLLTR